MKKKDKLKIALMTVATISLVVIAFNSSKPTHPFSKDYQYEVIEIGNRRMPPGRVIEKRGEWILVEGLSINSSPYWVNTVEIEIVEPARHERRIQY